MERRKRVTFRTGLESLSSPNPQPRDLDAVTRFVDGITPSVTGGTSTTVDVFRTRPSPPATGKECRLAYETFPGGLKTSEAGKHSGVGTVSSTSLVGFRGGRGGSSNVRVLGPPVSTERDTLESFFLCP